MKEIIKTIVLIAFMWVAYAFFPDIPILITATIFTLVMSILLLLEIKEYNKK